MYVQLMSSDKKNIVRRAQIAEVQGQAPQTIIFEGRMFYYDSDKFVWVKQHTGASTKERASLYAEGAVPSSVVAASPTWEEGEDGQ